MKSNCKIVVTDMYNKDKLVKLPYFLKKYFITNITKIKLLRSMVTSVTRHKKYKK